MWDRSSDDESGMSPNATPSYAMKVNLEDNDDEEEVWEEGRLATTTTPLGSSSAFSFSDQHDDDESKETEDEIWEDPENSHHKLVTSSSRDLPFAQASPLWRGIEFNQRVHLNRKLKDYKVWFKQKQKNIRKNELAAVYKNSNFVEDNKLTNTRPWIDIFANKNNNKLLRPVLGDFSNNATFFLVLWRLNTKAHRSRTKCYIEFFTSCHNTIFVVLSLSVYPLIYIVLKSRACLMCHVHANVM